MDPDFRNEIQTNRTRKEIFNVTPPILLPGSSNPIAEWGFMPTTALDWSFHRLMLVIRTLQKVGQDTNGQDWKWIRS